jgi:glutathione S-transferase
LYRKIQIIQHGILGVIISAVFMLNLYFKPTCFYTKRVLAANESIGAPLVLHNVAEDAMAKEHAIRVGGKTQTPFLEDTDRGVALYESAEIIAYLTRQYGTGSTKPNALSVDTVCPIE